MSTCCKCSTNITKGRFPGVKCSGPCENLFHVKCAIISEDLFARIKEGSANWLCENCRLVSSQSLIESEPEDMANISLADIMLQLKIMESKLLAFDEFKENVFKMKADNEFLMAKVQKLESRLETNTSKLNLLEALSDKSNQANNATSIAISGLPMSHGDIKGMILSTINNVDQSVQADDILSIVPVHRNLTPASTSTISKSKTHNMGMHDFFIVKLKSTDLKNNLLALMRKKKTLYTNNLEVSLPQNHQQQRIFIMQHFTKFQSQLYREAKSIKTKYNYKFLWVKNGQIYLRKTAETDIHRIHSWNDIFLLRSNNHPIEESSGTPGSTMEPRNTIYVK